MNNKVWWWIVGGVLLVALIVILILVFGHSGAPVSPSNISPPPPLPS